MEKPSAPKKKAFSKDRVEVYEIIFGMAMKLLLAVAGLIAFFIILYFVITEKDNVTKAIYAFFDLMLGGSIYLVYKHYFPSKK